MDAVDDASAQHGRVFVPLIRHLSPSDSHQLETDDDGLGRPLQPTGNQQLTVQLSDQLILSSPGSRDAPEFVLFQVKICQ